MIPIEVNMGEIRDKKGNYTPIAEEFDLECNKVLEPLINKYHDRLSLEAMLAIIYNNSSRIGLINVITYYQSKLEINKTV